MKTFVAFAGILLIGAGAAFGQAGTIGLYADPAGLQCSIDDTGPGPLFVYAVHTGTNGAAGSSFSAPIPACMEGATWLADEHLFAVTLGNTQTGVSMGYGACLEGPIHVLTLSFWVNGQSATCCPLRVLPTPGVRSEQIEGVSCDLEMNFPAGGTITVNADSSCPCAGQTAANDERTWGSVKSLYSSTE